MWGWEKGGQDVRGRCGGGGMERGGQVVRGGGREGGLGRGGEGGMGRGGRRRGGGGGEEEEEEQKGVKGLNLHTNVSYDVYTVHRIFHNDFNMWK